MKDVYVDFGKMLSYYRVERSMTRNEVAEYLDVALNTYGQYERGERKIPLSHAITLSQLLKFDLNDFINNERDSDIDKSSRSTWDDEFSDVTFTEEEIEELKSYARYILSKRESEK